MFEIDSSLRTLVERGGSDLHVKVGVAPTIRLHGELMPLEGYQPLNGEETEKAFRDIAEPRSVTEFDQAGEADFSYSIRGLSRFRVNVFRQRGSVSIVCRAIPFEIRSVEELGLPPVVTTLAEEQRGIILVTGTTGSGKSTTLAAMIDHINRTRSDHIITLEDPIEYLHEDKNSIVNQREVGSDTESFARAMRRVLRQDPDVILIGELRDAETAQTALQAAESGHLVLSTLHTVDAAETLGRMIEFFPEAKQQMIRSVMAGVLRGVISQRLLPRIDGGRVAAVEVMVTNTRIADLIRENKPEAIEDAIDEGAYFDMQTFSQSLIDLVVAGIVDQETAANAATNRHDFLVTLERALKQQRADIAAVEKQEEQKQEEERPPEPEVPTLRLAQAGD